MTVQKGFSLDIKFDPLANRDTGRKIVLYFGSAHHESMTSIDAINDSLFKALKQIYINILYVA